MSSHQNVYNIGEWVNRETGELVQGIVTDVRTLEQDARKKDYKANKQLNAKTETPFVFYFMETVKGLTETLQKDSRNRSTYLGYLLILNTYLDYEGVLYKTDNTEKPLNRTGIQKVLKIGCNKASKTFIDYMLEQDVLKEVTTDNGKGFAMNNIYTLRGDPESKQVLRVYNKTLREMYEKNSAEDFTFIYSLIPYIDFEYNTICFNPYEKYNKHSTKSYEERINVMSIQDVAEITSVSVQTVYTKLRDLTFDNEPIFHRVKAGDTQFIVINPALLARGTFEEDDKVRGYFKIKGK